MLSTSRRKLGRLALALGWASAFPRLPTRRARAHRRSVPLRRPRHLRPATAAVPMSQPMHGFALYGTPALPPGFAHFPYVNPDAPAGGEIVLAGNGSFDSFNPFILRGHAAAESTRIYDTLLRESADEPSVGYGHLAQSLEVAADRLSAAYNLRPEAKFHDGHPVTAEDVVWTFTTLRDSGRPNYRQYYADRRQRDGRGAAPRGVPLQERRQPRVAADRGARCRCCRSIGGRAATSPRH